MREFDKYALLSQACRIIKQTAQLGSWDGRAMTQYFENCKWYFSGIPMIVVFTRDTGYHSGGWWKNPDYERCWHLSISFPGGRDKIIFDKVIKYLFDDYSKLIWTEGPYSENAKKKGVWHYRLFCDEHWRPIKPRGEVYSTQFTGLGWKSFSELTA